MRARKVYLGWLGVAVVCGCAPAAYAYEAEVDASIDAQYYTLSSPWGTPEVRYRRYTETLGLAVWNISGSPDPRGSRLSFQSRMRLDADFGQSSAERALMSSTYIPGLQEAPLDLMYAYLEGERYFNGYLGFRIGRQYVFDTLGFWSFDGGLVSLSTPGNLVFEAYAGFEQRGGGMPTFGTRLGMTNRDFFERIGVTATETFAPGDMELEPHFDVVAEWQDYRATSSLRLQDMIMDKFFEWMDTGGYRFKEDLTARLIAVMGRASSYLSEDAKTLISGVVPKVPPNMSRRAIATIAMLHSTAERVLRDLELVEEERIARTGRPLHPREVRVRLEELRQASNGRIGYLCAGVR